MRKFLFLILFQISIFAGMIDGIAIVVNGEPITTYDIYKVKKELHIDDKKAKAFLISKMLEESEVRRRRIQVSDFEVDKAFEKVAKSNGLRVDEFKNVLISKNISIKKFKEELRKQLGRDKLYQMIIKSKMIKPTDEEAKEFFEKNKARFIMPKIIEVVSYSSFNREDLIELYKNPIKFNPNIERREENLETEAINPRLLQILLATPENRFTQILPIGHKFVMYYIKKKSGLKTLPFEKMKNRILTFMFMTKKQEVLDNYFKKLKSEADIKYIR